MISHLSLMWIPIYFMTQNLQCRGLLFNKSIHSKDLKLKGKLYPFWTVITVVYHNFFSATVALIRHVFVIFKNYYYYSILRYLNVIDLVVLENES